MKILGNRIMELLLLFQKKMTERKFIITCLYYLSRSEKTPEKDKRRQQFSR